MPNPTIRIRDYSKRGDALRVPDLTRVQQDAYKRFLQLDVDPEKRSKLIGLESLLREIFEMDAPPGAKTHIKGIKSYDGSMRLEYTHYILDRRKQRATLRLGAEEMACTITRTTNRGYRLRFDEPLAAHIVDDLVQRYPLPG